MSRPASGVALDCIRKDESENARATRRWSLPYTAIGTIVAFSDFFLIIATSVATGIVYQAFAFGGDADLVRLAVTAVIIGTVFVFWFRDRGLYDPEALMNISLQTHRITAYWVVTLLVFVGAAFALKVSTDFSRGSIILFGVVGLLTVVGHHALWAQIVQAGLAKRIFRGRPSILIDTTTASQTSPIVDNLTASGFEIQLSVALNAAKGMEQTIEDVIARARGSDIEEIFVAADIVRWKEVDFIGRQLSVLPIPVTFVPDRGSSQLFRRPLRQFGKVIGIECHRPPLSVAERFMKRLMDLACAITGIVLLMPLFVIVAIMIKLDSPGPALFIQTRQGFNSKRFGILKFRTMTVLDDGAVVKQAERDDKRVTRVGLWLRKTSIDELPQLLNVLLGTMSIVGPRPHATAHDNYFGDLISTYAFRHHMKPGITGWAQVNGYRGETPNIQAMKDRVDLDLWYINNWSMALDAQIILRTALEVVRGRNAY